MPSYLLRVRARFEAAHHLSSYRGAPEPSHGHSWQVEAALRTTRLDGEGMAYDFVALRRALGELTGRLDHRDLNSLAPFDRRSPTTEHLAAWFYDELRGLLPDAPLDEVTVWEGPDCSAAYRADRTDAAGERG
jgi:6-pyruvoyltetrahydropterin/6-carboxytetrahydropterin synthase